MAPCACGESETHYDEGRGETVCVGCGNVRAQGAMVDSLQFYGGGNMAGQFISASTGTVKGFAAAYGSGASSESSILRGMDNMRRIADFLKLPESLVESASRLYRLAFLHRFTKGRKNALVVTACLYIVCRKESRPIMLIDFSDALRTPVKILAQVFVKLIRELHMAVPQIDPSLFMERYASLMNLGEKTKTVAATGVRLVQAMTRDWIATGRRPIGLCGAALLVAARLHGFKLNAEDVRQIFRMSASTIDKRVDEFSHTATANLRVKDFETTDLLSLPILKGPPCWERGKRKAASAVKNAIEDRRSSLGVLEEDPTDGPTTGDDDELITLWGEGTHEHHRPIEMKTSDFSSMFSVDGIGELAVTMVKAIADTTAQDEVSVVLTPTRRGGAMLSSMDEALDEVKSKARDLLLSLDDDMMMTPSTTVGDDEDLKTAAAQDDEVVSSVVKQENNRQTISTDDMLQLDNDADDSLDDISDSEIAKYLLSEDEVIAKTKIWDDLMKDILPELKRRWERRKRRQEEGAGESSTRRRVTSKSENNKLASTDSVTESLRLGLRLDQKVNLERKFNLDALETFFSNATSASLASVEHSMLTSFELT